MIISRTPHRISFFGGGTDYPDYYLKHGGKVLGAAIVSIRGEHIAHLLAWAISKNKTIQDMLQMPYYHPVIEEAMQACLYNVKSKLEVDDNNKIYELEELSDD